MDTQSLSGASTGHLGSYYSSQTPGTKARTSLVTKASSTPSNQDGGVLVYCMCQHCTLPPMTLSLSHLTLLSALAGLSLAHIFPDNLLTPDA